MKWNTFKKHLTETLDTINTRQKTVKLSREIYCNTMRPIFNAPRNLLQQT